MISRETTGPSWRIHQGDAHDVLLRFDDQSIDCCVTSPPYWGLRDYGVAGQYGLEPTPAAYVWIASKRLTAAKRQTSLDFAPLRASKEEQMKPCRSFGCEAPALAAVNGAMEVK